MNFTILKAEPMTIEKLKELINYNEKRGTVMFLFFFIILYYASIKTNVPSLSIESLYTGPLVPVRSSEIRIRTPLLISSPKASSIALTFALVEALLAASLFSFLFFLRFN